MKVYNAFIYFNEIPELLEIRFAELYELVDYFIVVEAEESFTEVEKRPRFPYYKRRLAPWMDKIRYYNIGKLSEHIKGNTVSTRWKKQWFQYDQIRLGLYDANPEDWLFISDADEIPKKESIEKAKSLRLNSFTSVAFMMPYHYYYFNVKDKYNVLFRTIHGRQMKHVKEVSKIRMGTKRTYKLYNSGWHFSYLGDEKIVKKKMESIPSSDVTRKHAQEEKIKKCKNNLEDILGRGRDRWQVVELDSSYPQYLLENKKRFLKYIYKGECYV